MNERIRELYMQVLHKSENDRWNIEDAEKFAELIVRECAKIGYMYGGLRVRLAIQEKFGVEE